MLLEKLRSQILAAMKAKDELRVSTLKMLSSALKNEEIAKRPDKITKEDELRIVKSEVKKRKDAIDAYKKAGRKKQAEKEENELEILESYLPKQMSNNALEKIVTTSIEQSGANSLKDMGKVIGLVMKKVGDKADGGRVAEIVKKQLS